MGLFLPHAGRRTRPRRRPLNPARNPARSPLPCFGMAAAPRTDANTPTVRPRTPAPCHQRLRSYRAQLPARPACVTVPGPQPGGRDQRAGRSCQHRLLDPLRLHPLRLHPRALSRNGRDHRGRSGNRTICDRGQSRTDAGRRRLARARHRRAGGMLGPLWRP